MVKQKAQGLYLVLHAYVTKISSSEAALCPPSFRCGGSVYPESILITRCLFIAPDNRVKVRPAFLHCLLRALP